MQIEDREMRVTKNRFERENKEGGMNDVYRIARMTRWENKEKL